MKRRLLGFAAALAVAGLAATGCSNGSGGSDKATVGASMLNMRDPDLVVMSDAMTKAASSENIDLVTVDSRGDVPTELSQIEDLVTRNPKAIVMMPLDATSSQTAAKRVIDANIPLFILSTRFPDDAGIDYKAYVGVDDTEAGRMQAQYVNDSLPQGGKIIYIVGTYGAPWTDRRKTGFDETLNDNITIASEMAANGSRDEAKRTMEDLLRRYAAKGEIVGLVAQNDEMAIGAASAIKEAGRQDEFKVVVGVDGTKPGLEAVSNGELTATVLQDSAGQGTKVMETVSAFLADQPIEKENILPFELVTKENAADFHS